MITKSIKFFREVIEELGKVTWPTRQEAIRMTVTVIIVSVAISALIGSLDFALTKLMSGILAR